jgi:hypothetical protein
MCLALLMSCAIVGAGDPPATAERASTPALELYRARRAQAGKSSDAQVRLALWCEAHGLNAERMKHLALAALQDPSNALARGLMGLVAYQGKWERPEQVSQVVQNDPQHTARIREYLERRTKAPDRADDQWKLALWCEQNDLKQQATAHFYRVLQLDPSRDAAWKHLGYKRIGGRWDKPERVAAAKTEADQQHKADKHWKPFLEGIVHGLASKDKARRAQAEKNAVDVTDARAVPMIWVVVVNAGAQHQSLAVRLLAQIDSPGSSRALAFLALMSRSAEVRSGAVRVLKQRDPRDFAAVLIALLRDPIKYEVRSVNGPGSQGQLVIKRKDVNVKRLYSPLAAPELSLLPGDRVVLDANGLPVVVRDLGQYQSNPLMLRDSSFAGVAAAFGFPMVPTNGAQIAGMLGQAGFPAGVSQKLGATLARNAASVVNAPMPQLVNGAAAQVMDRELDIPIGQMTLDAQRSAEVAEQQLASDVQAIEDYNGPIVETNQRVRQVLSDSVGVDLGPEKLAWDRWLVDLSGYAFVAAAASETPTVVQEVPISYQPQAVPVVIDQPLNVAVTVHHSCFGAGTPVRTLEGSSLIETLRAGDLVLVQDPATGELNYRPVVTVYHNPPNRTLRIDLGTETIVATGIHRFWKAGRGWVMARDLKPGDTLRTVGGLATVKSVADERIQRVYNLQIAGGESFFVGRAGVLAHDNSLVRPTPDPFDAVAERNSSTTP